jgi:hypothetical protein
VHDLSLTFIVQVTGSLLQMFPNLVDGGTRDVDNVRAAAPKYADRIASGGLKVARKDATGQVQPLLPVLNQPVVFDGFPEKKIFVAELGEGEGPEVLQALGVAQEMPDIAELGRRLLRVLPQLYTLRRWGRASQLDEPWV